MHKRDYKVDVVTEHSHKEAFSLTVGVSEGERLEVGKRAFLEQDMTKSGSQFLKPEERGQQS